MEALMRSVPPEAMRSSTGGAAVDPQAAMVTWVFRAVLRLLVDHFDAVGSSAHAGDGQPGQGPGRL